MDARESVLDVNSGSHREGEGHVAAASEDLRTHGGSQFREQDGERRRSGGGHAVRPDRLDQLVAGDCAATIECQVGEQKPTLAAREIAVDPAAPELDGERAAELDSCRRDELQRLSKIAA